MKNHRQSQLQELLRAGRHQEAESRLLDICKAPDADAESWFLLGAMRGIRGDARGAEDCFREALGVNPAFHQARFNLGIALRDQGRLDEAREMLEAVTSVHANHAEAQNALGYVYFHLGRTEDAEHRFRAAVRANPSFPEALTNLGNVLSSRKRRGEAVALYREALRLAPGHGEAALNLGNALMELGQAEEAISLCRQAVVANPSNAEARILLGRAFQRLGRRQEAEAAFREAVKVKPDHPEARFFLAAMGRDAAPPSAPEEYITRLFDDYAECFDGELVGKLRYCVPEAIYRAVQSARGQQRALDVIDLGCGTGLCGPVFKPMSRTLAGVDLSSKMVAKARDRFVYDALEVGEITDALLKRTRAVDLAIAADVFIYVGELAPVFSAAANALRPEGLFAFSVEVASREEGDSYVLRSTGRYAHAQGYIADLAARFGFVLLSREDLAIRMDNGQAIQGAIYVLQRSADGYRNDNLSFVPVNGIRNP